MIFSPSTRNILGINALDNAAHYSGENPHFQGNLRLAQLEFATRGEISSIVLSPDHQGAQREISYLTNGLFSDGQVVKQRSSIAYKVSRFVRPDTENTDVFTHFQAEVSDDEGALNCIYLDTRTQEGNFVLDMQSNAISPERLLDELSQLPGRKVVFLLAQGSYSILKILQNRANASDFSVFTTGKSASTDGAKIQSLHNVLMQGLLRTEKLSEIRARLLRNPTLHQTSDIFQPFDTHI